MPHSTLHSLLGLSVCLCGLDDADLVGLRLLVGRQAQALGGVDLAGEGEEACGAAWAGA